MARAELAQLRCAWLFLLLGVCLCQKNCTDVDCPLLKNCIDEVLESGSCCASCLQKGCTCEGYQYYDCINAGFKDGKVPEGDSYFVDYGSTECSCPEGGGPISCHFISCPEVPLNCIEVLEPVDGCMHCRRVGCIHGGQKYDAGHSFHIDHCRVCHCPNDGGEIMCYPVSDCVPQEVHQPMLAAPTEDNMSNRTERFPNRFDQMSTLHLPPNGNLPLFKFPPLDKDESEDYDYNPADYSETYSHVFAPLTQSSTFPNKILPISQDSGEPDRASATGSLNLQEKMELREQYQVHDHPAEREDGTGSPLSEDQRTDKPPMDATTPQQELASTQSVSSGGLSSYTDLKSPVHADTDLGGVAFSLNQDLASEENPKYHGVNSESTLMNQRGSQIKPHQHNTSDEMRSSQININHLKTSVEPLPNQEKGSDRIEVPLYKLINPETPIHLSSELNNPEEPHVREGKERFNEDEIEERRVTFQTVTGLREKDVTYTVTSAEQERTYKDLEASQTPSPESPEDQQTPEAQSITRTTQPPVSSRRDEDLLSGRPPPSADGEDVGEEEEGDHLSVLPIKPEGDSGVSSEDLLQSCCVAGQKWARRNNHCLHMPVLNESSSVCSVVQKQCCLSSVKESLCETGMTSARAGHTCEAEEQQPCTDDYQVCCSCCALGLWMRNQGRGCSGHQYLSYPCGHIFLTCCEEEEGLNHFPLWRKQKPRPTALPRRVPDSSFPKEAFSISASEEAPGVLEEHEDECQLHHRQLCQHTCTNVWGSYRCGCHPGYVLQQDGHSCAAASPEEESRVRAKVNPTQTSTITSTTTSTSAHLHPCAGNGGCSQQCTSVAGRPHCSCFPGFSVTADGRTCEDVDECVTNSHSCQPGERCVNTPGSFVCELQVTCPPGYQLKNSVCQDINECSSLSTPCSEGSTCINTVGSYTCQQKILMCSRGYHASSDRTKCVDADECQSGTHHCGLGQTCHNLPGSYRCDCQTGYQYDALRKVCTDVNECWRYPGRLCAQTCENTPGSYHCSCTAGFSLAFDGKNCEDVNECDNNPCSQECVNIHGSYQCYCREGYYLKEDGHTCQDIDECSQSMGNLCAFQCVNVVGSYQCACPPLGYVTAANGRTCKDIDECKTGTHNCSFIQTCYNLHGGFKCLSFDCPPNYNKVSDTRCERIMCPTNSYDCQNSPVRITYHQLSFQTNIITPAQIFRIGPSLSYSGDYIVIGIPKGNEEGYFSARKLNSFTGAVYLQRKVREPKDFLIDVEMKLLRQGTVTSFLTRLYVFITSTAL